MSRKSNTIANKVYIFVHIRDEYVQTNIKDRSFSNNWIELDANGKITVKGSYSNGYAWDGCSPKFHFLQFVVGTPDGRLDYNTEKPLTYFASMFHDVIYQFKDEIDISRKEADLLFKVMLRQTGFRWWWLYYFGVRVGGVFYGKWKRKESIKKIKVSGNSW